MFKKGDTALCKISDCWADTRYQKVTISRTTKTLAIIGNKPSEIKFYLEDGREYGGSGNIWSRTYRSLILYDDDLYTKYLDVIEKKSVLRTSEKILSEILRLTKKGSTKLSQIPVDRIKELQTLLESIEEQLSDGD